MDSKTIDLITENCLEVTGVVPSKDAILRSIGRWGRIADVSDRKGAKSCGLKLHDHGDYYVGTVINHKTDVSKNFYTRTGKHALMTPEEKAAAQRQRKEYQRQQAERSVRKDRMLSAAVRRIWPNCERPENWDKPHPYVEKKDIQPLNVRRNKSHKRDVLVLPMVCPFEGLKSFYLVFPNGFKRPLRGTQMSGLCMVVSDRPLSTSDSYFLTEGWATACSLFELKGEPVVVAFSAGNLEAVADKLVRKYPHAELKLCCDDDRKTLEKTGRNPGIEYAKKVQERHPSISLWRPLFPEGSPRDLSDVNDAMQYEKQVQGMKHG